MRILTSEVVNHIGEEIMLEGWIHNVRVLPEFSFIVLRDRAGQVQGIIENPKFEVPELKNESSIRIKGMAVKSEIAKAGFEIKITGIDVLSPVVDELPTQINKKNTVEHLERLLDFRYFSLRHPKLSAVFKVQALICRGFREYLISQDFTEIHTPKIVASGTEGGANLFKVDYFGRPAYLAQSPQFYKQMMVSVFERVFEVAPVFRAEPHNTSRHVNEYTSLDFEMGFIKDEYDIMDVEEGILRHTVNLINEHCNTELGLLGASVTIPTKIPRLRMTEVHDILEKHYKIKYPQGFDIDPEGERAICEFIQKETGSEFVFVTGYPVESRPMYTYPDSEHPGDTRGFDLLYRGMEITTGGQRIHLYDMLIENIKTFKCNPDDFSFYTNVFKYGVPPHGGLAIGLERITCQMLGLKNVREGTLFPRDLDRLTP